MQLIFECTVKYYSPVMQHTNEMEDLQLEKKHWEAHWEAAQKTLENKTSIQSLLSVKFN